MFRVVDTNREDPEVPRHQSLLWCHPLDEPATKAVIGSSSEDVSTVEDWQCFFTYLFTGKKQ